MSEGKKFGWTSVINEYSWHNILEDAKYPFVFSLVFISLLIRINADIYLFLDVVIETSIDIIPIMLSFILAGYAILLSLYWSDFGSKVKKMHGGEELLNKINSSFSIAILIMILGVIISVIARFVYSLNLQSNYSIPINYFACFIIIFISIYSIWIIKDITINIYNLGKASVMI
jgi:hypothetical protein